MPELNDIIDTAEHLLDTIRRVYAEERVDLPVRQYYVVGGSGQTVHDCEQVTVSWDQAYSGIPANEASLPATCDGMHTASFIVEVVRQVNTIRSTDGSPGTVGTNQANVPGRYGNAAVGGVDAPAAEDFMREARVQMQDAVLLLRAGLLAGEGTVGGNSIVDVSAGTPQGNLQAVVMNFTATLGLDPFKQQV